LGGQCNISEHYFNYEKDKWTLVTTHVVIASGRYIGCAARGEKAEIPTTGLGLHWRGAYGETIKAQEIE